MILKRWHERTQSFRQEVYAVYLACNDPRTPWYAKWLGACIIAYALSPIDLIPDFIPIIGYLDDILIVPLGATLLLKMIPKEVLEECRVKATGYKLVKGGMLAPTLIIVFWLVLSIWFIKTLLKIFS